MTPGHDPAPPDPPPPVLTPVVCGACLLWFLVWLALADARRIPPSEYLAGRRPDALLAAGGVTGPSLVVGEWWRLGSSLFVHGGALHLLFNLYALAVIGPATEFVWGRRRAAAVFAVGGLAGVCLAMGLRPNSLLCGVSGAVWALLAAVVVWLRRYHRTLPKEDARRAARRVGLTVLLGAAVSAVPGVSWEGHLGGAIGGAVTAALLDRRRWVLTLLFAATCPGGLLAAVVYAKNWRPVCQLAAAARLAPLVPPRVLPLAQHAQAAAVSGIRPPTLTPRAVRMAADARAAGGGWVPAPELVRLRPYARAVAALAEAAADPADPAMIRERRQAVEAAWKELGG